MDGLSLLFDTSDFRRKQAEDALEKSRRFVERIADDGIGLPLTEAPKEGMGLRIMRYRAGQIGAHFSVHPGPNRGTVVTCTLFRGTFNE